MGYDTYFSGSITVEPPLNDDEAEWLHKFSESRRMHRKLGPYYIGGGSGDYGSPDILDSNSPDPSQPGLWCQWVPGEDGLVWDEGEKFYDAEEWMRYIIDEFLKPGATVKQLRAADPNDPLLDGVPEFADHVCNGTINCEGEENGDLWRIIVTNNEVEREDAIITWPSEQGDRA